MGTQALNISVSGVIAMLIVAAGCEGSSESATRVSAGAGFPSHIDQLFTAVPAVAPDDLMSREGQVFMQMLPAVGREDIHAKQHGWPIRAAACRKLEPASRVIDDIVDAAKDTTIVIINEAHDRPRHREFVRLVAVALYPKGYSHYAAETFADTVSSRVSPTFPVVQDGYYSNEPVFGALLRELIALGFHLRPYEYRGNNGSVDLDAYASANLREEGQADNLQKIVDALDKSERLLVHVGYSHASEVPIRSFGGKDLAWMASRLKEKTGIDPLTIEQTDCAVEGSQSARTEPSSKHQPGQFDIVVGHPLLSFVDSRPSWRRNDGMRSVRIPHDLRSDMERVIIEARYVSDSPDAVPLDRVMVWAGEDVPLLLAPGEYSLVSFFEETQIVVASSISVPTK